MHPRYSFPPAGLLMRSLDVRNRATTGGVNVEFGGGKVRLLADYVSRKIGTPGTRRGALITQAQVKF